MVAEISDEWEIGRAYLVMASTRSRFLLLAVIRQTNVRSSESAQDFISKVTPMTV